jgi:hypothetical protein
MNLAQFTRALKHPLLIIGTRNFFPLTNPRKIKRFFLCFLFLTTKKRPLADEMNTILIIFLITTTNESRKNNTQKSFKAKTRKKYKN